MPLSSRNFKINLFVPEISAPQIDLCIPKNQAIPPPLVYADSKDDYLHQRPVSVTLSIPVRFWVYQ